MNRFISLAVLGVISVFATPSISDAGHVDGMSLYRAYFVPGGTDSSGLQEDDSEKQLTIHERYPELTSLHDELFTSYTEYWGWSPLHPDFKDCSIHLFMGHSNVVGPIRRQLQLPEFPGIDEWFKTHGIGRETGCHQYYGVVSCNSAAYTQKIPAKNRMFPRPPIRVGLTDAGIIFDDAIQAIKNARIQAERMCERSRENVGSYEMEDCGKKNATCNEVEVSVKCDDHMRRMFTTGVGPNGNIMKKPAELPPKNPCDENYTINCASGIERSGRFPLE